MHSTFESGNALTVHAKALALHDGACGADVDCMRREENIAVVGADGLIMHAACEPSKVHADIDIPSLNFARGGVLAPVVDRDLVRVGAESHCCAVHTRAEVCLLGRVAEARGVVMWEHSHEIVEGRPVVEGHGGVWYFVDWECVSGPGILLSWRQNPRSRTYGNFFKNGKKSLKKKKKLGCGIRTNLKSSVPNLRFAPHGRI